MRSIALPLVVLLAGCGGRADKPVCAEAQANAWRAVATPADRDRLREWHDDFVAGLDAARAAGHASAIAAQGPLLEVDRAMADPLPPPGDYRCRMVKLGAKRPGDRAYAAPPAQSCRIGQEEGALHLEVLDGVQRPIGHIFGGDSARAAFLGTLMLGDEARPIDYGRDAIRDMAGYVERIEERRWRIVLPSPAFESRADIMEIVPVS